MERDDQKRRSLKNDDQDLLQNVYNYLFVSGYTSCVVCYIQSRRSKGSMYTASQGEHSYREEGEGKIV